MKHFPESKLLFTDTDSFFYLIPTEINLYEYIKGNHQYFDFSNYEVNHPNYDDSNYLTPGKFKDEFGGFFIEEFVGLRSKMYSILKYGGEEKKAANGVLEQVKKREITHEDYLKCLKELEARYHQGMKIMQKDHQLYSVNIVKKSLNPYNDKKYIFLDDGNFTCYSYGNFRINLL